MNEWSTPTRATITSSPPGEVSDVLRRLGSNLRTARVRRRLRIQDIADRIGASRVTVTNVEKGKPSVSAAAYFGVLWALGLLSDADHVADPDRDEEGKIRLWARFPDQAPHLRPLRDDF